MGKCLLKMKILIVLRNIGPYHNSRFEALINSGLNITVFETRPQSQEYFWGSSDNYKYTPNLSYTYSVGSEKKVLSNMFIGVEASVVSLSAAVMFGEANNSNTTNVAFTVSTLDKFKLYAKVGLN